MEELKSFRESVGMTPQAFARFINVSFSLYQKVESGNRSPSRKFTEKLKSCYPQFDVNVFYKNVNHKTWNFPNRIIE